MKIDTLSEILDLKVTGTRENRNYVTTLILNDNSLFWPLLQITFDIDNKTSIKAAWVLEFVLNKKLEWLAPHLTHFTKHISEVHLESAVRPISKICAMIANSYRSKSDTEIKTNLSSKDIQNIIETSFDLLISKHKVAVKVYAMETLFLLGKEEQWIHDELKLIIHQNITKQTHAYVARGKRTLLRIEKIEKKMQ
jgi:hypothetical protein